MLYFIEMEITINGEDEMKIFGARIGSALRGGECIELIGDVGAGKTTLTKGIAAGMMVEETVQSPTFTISRTYDSPKGIRLNHYDFYRLSDPGIMSDELAESLQDSDTSIVIEWGDIVESVLPDDHLTITIISPTEGSRVVKLDAHGEVSQKLVEVIA